MRIAGTKRNRFVRQPLRTLILLVILAASLLTLLFWQGSKYQVPLKVPSKTILFCDAEETDGKYFLTNTFKVRGGETQSDSISFSGAHASRAYAEQPYGMGFDMKQPAAGKAFRISVWMYRTGTSRGRLVASADDAEVFYSYAEIPIEKRDDGWALLRLYFIVPPGYGDRIKIYTYNPGGDEPVYFDDLHIEEIQPYMLPGSEEEKIDQVRLSFPGESMEKLREKEADARHKGILITEESDWVDGVLMDNKHQEIEIKARLKGDYLDHLSGQKWSLRIRPKNGLTWNRMRTFSIQSPHTRSFMREWVFHQMLMDGDVLATRYDFMHVDVDSLHSGIYAVEEHFEKQLLESQSRREGPILKLEEDGFWLGYKRQNDLYGDQMLGERMENAFWKSDIKPFRENKVLENPVLAKQFAAAQNLLFAYKYGTKDADEVFDVQRLAEMYAIMDVNDAYHAKAWHNQRFYFNPVTALLEPVGFDGFGDRPVPIGKPFLGYYFNAGKSFIPFYETPFMSPAFFRQYCRTLQEWTDPDTLEQFFIRHHIAIEDRVSVLQKEYEDYQFDRGKIMEKAKKIRALTEPYPDISLVVRTRRKNKTERQVSIYNKHCLPLEVIGYGITPDKMSATLVRRLYVPQQVKGNAPEPVDAKLPAFATHVFFTLAGTDRTYSTPVSELPGYAPPLVSDQTETINDLSNTGFISRFRHDVIIRKGDHVLSGPLVVGKDETLIIEAGTRLDLQNGAYLLSYGPVIAMGTAEKPIEVLSSDRTGKGFTVIQATARSQLSNISFHSLNTLSLEDRELTGAVTFYESDVDLKQVEIANNLCEDGLNMIRSDFLIEHLYIHHTLSDGFDADFCTGQVKRSIFSHTGNDGMDISGSQVTIGETRIDNAGDKGISVGEESSVMVWNAVIMDSNIGVASKDLSDLNIFYIELTNCGTGYAVYQKKPEYGPAKLGVTNEVIRNVRRKHLVETGSVLTLGETMINGYTDVEI